MHVEWSKRNKEGERKYVTEYMEEHQSGNVLLPGTIEEESQNASYQYDIHKYDVVCSFYIN